MPAITVGVPAFRTRFLLPAISSVLAQTLGDFELLVSDDSADGAAGDLVRRLRDPRLRLIAGPRRGAVANQRRIWEAAQADLLLILHDDDQLLPDALATLAGALARDVRFTFAAGRRVIVDALGRELRRPLGFAADDWLHCDPAKLAQHLVRTTSCGFGETSNLLIRRAAFADSASLGELAGLPITRLTPVALLLNAARRGPGVATAACVAARRELRAGPALTAVELAEWEAVVRAAVHLGLAPADCAVDGLTRLEAAARSGGDPAAAAALRQELPVLKELLGRGSRQLITAGFRKRLAEAQEAARRAPTAEPSAADERAGRIHARLERLSRRSARGWAWAPDTPELAVHVEAMAEGRVIGHGTADQPDQDDGEAPARAQRFEFAFYEPLVGAASVQFRFFTRPVTGAGAFQLPPAENAAAPAAGQAEAPLREHARFTAPGPQFEALAEPAARPRRRDGPDPLLLAFYLPQFHPIAENDRHWGAGFTEWRQLPRAAPRFPGHYQPRTPRDLGFYNLLDPEVLRRQTELARGAGVGAFAFYYYWFNGRRVLERPLDGLLRSDQQTPFLLIWANENWTRGWDGSDREVLLRQDYRAEDEAALLADLARHMADPRYVRLEGRPLFVVYSVRGVPDPARTFARWRQAWRRRYGLEPLIYMAQTFGLEDPRLYGLDGALEFPPHKLGDRTPPREVLDSFSRDFRGRVMRYSDLARASLDEPAAPYPLIKTAVPSWDNEARRPGRGVIYEGSTPERYQAWLQALIARAMARPVHGVPLVAINAWNEWAEGAYLEPDVHFGAAYLNATGRALDAAVAARNAAAAPRSAGRELVLSGAG